ncbi:MAG: tryptophan-rich sensory protein [Micavibrio aeruginosavorus]|uniref:Tryptophan-rich sensory protein n=1 Tax=Micavibrio aeruginosavorus TaxID=349221 RepID=A0A2W5HUH8_9BACT|nr:MAG: tryptophan-rich sensory protein [Micavibrio aeruginosavorus]
MTRISIKSYWTLPIWILAYLGVASFIGNMTRHAIPGWYEILSKPPLNPPDFIFPIVWSALYIMIASVGWRVWNRNQGKKIKIIFILQTLLNWAWSYLFFYYHWLGLSFIWIVGLIACVAALIYLLKHADRIAAKLLIPYFLWICFASYLNFMIWQLN